MIDDAILAREAYLIYQNAFGFEPDKGNMAKWRGIVRDNSGKEVEVMLVLPSNFPETAPEFNFSDSSVKHPVIGVDGKIITRSISRWKKDYHVFQIIREVRQAIASANFETETQQDLISDSDDVSKRQLVYLKNELDMKKQEYEKIKITPVSHSESHERTKQTLSDVTENALLNLQNELWQLEDNYDRIEIDGIEFSKKFVKLQKKYYMISKSS